MKKGKIITISIVSVVLVLLIVLTCTLFNLKTVDIEYLAQATNTNSVRKEEIFKSAQFKMGTNLLFTSYSKNVANIEKQCPAIKVMKVVKKFPNKITVYIVEREKQIRILGNDGYYYIFDEDLKVLHITATESEYENYCEVKGYELKEELREGDFLKDKTFKNKMSAILDGIYSSGRTPTSIMSSIVVSKINGVDSYMFTFKSGAKMKVDGSNKLEDKLFIGINAYNNESQKRTAEQLSEFKIWVTTKGQCNIDVEEDW